jgi:protein tyrosine phosphatase type 4A
MLVENNLSSNIEKKATLGVHCIAGLGRSPLLVAIVLIEAGLNVLDAVIFIREKRRGAINAKQLKFLESYKKRGKGNKIRKMAKDDGGDNVELNGKKSKECMVM